MKVIAFYLPQFHSIPENDEWWGKGFTEWTNVKTAKIYYEGQRQPRVPLNDNYYCLLDKEQMIWQSELAKQYGLYGFCFYHYWFNGHLLLEKPLDMYRQEIDNEKKINYCLCWANETWTRTWADKSKEVLIEQKYGGKEEWKKHFEYLLPFFKDERYIKENNKPFFVIYRPELIKKLGKMLDYWNKLAKAEGFDGICYAYQQYSYFKHHGKEEKKFTYNIEYQPDYVLEKDKIEKITFKQKVYKLFCPSFIKKARVKRMDRKVESGEIEYQPEIYDYDATWNRIIESNPSSNKAIAGVFVDYDNSPRRKDRGLFFKGVTKDKFDNYFRRQVEHVKNKYKTDYLFIFAWNEWGESAYLEPDEDIGYSYLESIKKYTSN